MDRLLRLVASLAVAVGLYVATAPTAFATYCLPPDLDAAQREADVVFVGTVAGVVNQGRWATVAVEEIWSGIDLPAVVEVRGSEIVNQDVWFSADRTYTAGQRYVFAVEVENGRLRDHACTATLAWIDELGRFRPVVVRGPAGARTVEATTLGGGSAAAAPAVLGVAFGGITALAGVAVLRRRRHGTGSP